MSLMRFAGDPKDAVPNFLSGLKCAFPSLTVDTVKRIVINNRVRHVVRDFTNPRASNYSDILPFNQIVPGM